MTRFGDNQDSDASDAGIDISPLIDCVFILLIFFIVTTVFVEEPGVEVDRPRAVSRERLQKTSILIGLTSEGKVFYANREIGVAGVQPRVARILNKEQVPVTIIPDQGAPSGKLVRVMEETKRAGAKKVNIANRRD